jgi:hypothetical protein
MLDHNAFALRILLAVVCAFALAAPTAAIAQTQPKSTADVPLLLNGKPAPAKPEKPLGYAPLPAPTVPGVGSALAPTPAKPASPSTAQAPDTDQAVKSVLKLKAVITEDGPEIKSGLVWRVFLESSEQDGDAHMKLVATSAGGDCEFKLAPGTYLVHAAYGRAGATIKVELSKAQRSETLILNAGGVKLSALLSGDIAIPEDRLSFDIFPKNSDSHGERQALVLGAAANKVVRLNADTYQIVSHYGNVNAIVRAEIHVNPGKLTEATVYHKAAEVTLKLVSEAGGEALTNVSWQVLTPGGDQVTESEGAFPTMVLAEGDYAVVARHQDRVFTRNFSVEAGYNREIELQVTKPASPGQ